MPNPTQQSSPRPQNRRGEGARLRGEIIAAVEALLASGPAEAITLRAVAKQAGVSAPAIYRHFEDRDQIMLTVVEAAFDQLADALRIARRGVDDPSGALQAVCRAYLTFAEQRPQQYRLLFGGAWDAAAALKNDSMQTIRLQDLGLHALQELRDALRTCRPCSAGGDPDLDSDTAALWVALHGLAELRRTTPLFPWPVGLEQRLIADIAHCR